MSNKQQLDQFLEQITKTVRNSFQTYGTTLSALAVTSASQSVGRELHANAIAFARAYQNHDVTSQELETLAGKVAGSLLTGQSLGVIHERNVQELLDELDKLMENR